MEAENKKIEEVRWEITEKGIKRRMDQKFLFIMTILTIGLSFIFLLMFSKFLAAIALVSIICLASFAHYINAKLKYNSGKPLESYKIDEKGIEIVRSRENKKELFMWSEVSGYHIADKNLTALMAYFLDILGRSIVIYINDHRKFSIYMESGEDYEKAIAELSKRTKLR